jgi:hypothetical protein
VCVQQLTCSFGLAPLAVQINKQLPASISIHNPTGDRLAFKVRCARCQPCAAE